MALRALSRSGLCTSNRQTAVNVARMVRPSLVQHAVSQGAMVTSRRLVLAAPFFTSSLVALAGPSGAAEDLKTSESGIQFVDLLEGTGPSPVKGARIK